MGFFYGGYYMEEAYAKYLDIIRTTFPEYNTLSDIDVLHQTISNYSEDTHTGFNVHKRILDGITSNGSYPKHKFNRCIQLSHYSYRIPFDSMNSSPYCITDTMVYVTDETLCITIAMCDGFENFVSIIKKT